MLVHIYVSCIFISIMLCIFISIMLCAKIRKLEIAVKARKLQIRNPVAGHLVVKFMA